MRTFCCVALVSMLAVGQFAWAQQEVSFELIPNASSATDMSPDGRFIVGSTLTGEPYLYDTVAGAMTILPPPGLSALAVSDDGTVVGGDVPDPLGIGINVAGRWTAATGWESLGALPAAGMCPSSSDTYEMSADGSVIIGLSFVNGCQASGFWWSEATGMLELESLANGVNRASVVSADGSLIAGFAQGSFSRTPCFWNSDQSGELLDPPSGDALGEIFGMRDDGSIMLGNWVGLDDPFGASLASTWTFDNGSWQREQIANGSLLPGWAGIPTDISDDGTIIGLDVLQQNQRAWIQYQGQGNLVLLKAWANSFGAGITAAQNLGIAEAITADGTRIIGNTSFSQAWMLTITPDEVLHGDVNMDGVVNLLDVAPFVDVLSTGIFQAEADVNKDGIVNLIDVAPFVDLISG